ncbi:MAG: alpha-galactosidase [Eubacterium sp.]|nr:alpha-galactosidase [Eubacterium sp.]
MKITFEKKNNTFWIDTAHTTYGIGLADGVYPGHIYYGKKFPESGREHFDVVGALRIGEMPFSPAQKPGEKVNFLDGFPSEFPCGGIGDYRESAVEITDKNGFTACEFLYDSYEISTEKPPLEGLPQTFGEDSMTLTLRLWDKVLGATLYLRYTIFEDADAIVRSARIENTSDEAFFIDKLYSAGMDMDDADYEMISFYGYWTKERCIERKPLRHGRQSVNSTRGITSHQSQPFLALVSPQTTQESGDVYAMHLIYSGNHIAQAELTPTDQVRLSIGISAERFRWKLAPGESFQAPEAVVLYTGDGLGGMTRQLHGLYKNHLIRNPYLHRERPILINNWEATYFDFDEEKLLAIAREAKACGIEMLVMDDGWFGHRDADDSSLGDWTVYEKKLPHGLKGLADKVNEIGLKFGIWMEPEMISPDSELYRAHPDYTLAIPGRTPSQSRNQYVLDLSRPEVVECVWEQIEAVIASAHIEYVKWDMNRPLADLGSTVTRGDRAGEIAHRYMLGVYELQERLVTRFPDLLLENCAGGGSRFDPGMLYYSPQIWCSDDTDARERLSIQEGTAMLYPLSTIGAHVSICPNHITGRTTPWCMRGNVALAGTFGYELDITQLSEEEKEEIRRQIALYHTYSGLIREGDYYRIASLTETGTHDCIQVVSSDKKESLAIYVQALATPNAKSQKLCLRGLDEDAKYNVTIHIDGREFGEEDREITSVRSGGELMNSGVIIPALPGDGRPVRVSMRA